MKKIGELKWRIGALWLVWAAVRPVCGDVVVTNLGPYGMGLPGDGTPGNLIAARYEIDLDGNGVWDVGFEQSTYLTIGATINTNTFTTRIQSFHAGRNVNKLAYSLSLGDEVGPEPLGGSSWLKITHSAGMRACADVGCAGTWPVKDISFCCLDEYIPGIGVPPLPGYLAVEFERESGTHYGWVKVGVNSITTSGIIYGWGWETEPGKPVVIVPEPGVLSLLAAGSLLLLIRRGMRKKGRLFS